MLTEKPENDHALVGGLDLDFRLCATLAARHTVDFLCKPTRTQGRIKPRTSRPAGKLSAKLAPLQFRLTCGG